MATASYVYGDIQRILQKSERIFKRDGLTVTLPDSDALFLYKYLTAKDEYGYVDTIPWVDSAPIAIKGVYYWMWIEDGYLHWGRNQRLNPPHNHEIRNRKHRKR